MALKKTDKICMQAVSELKDADYLMEKEEENLIYSYYMNYMSKSENKL